MFRQDTDQEDLKTEIYQLKKQNFNVQSENNILKVKLRRLREECLKKEKQIFTLLDPQKNIHFRKVMTDRGAHMVMNLKEKNEKLEQLLVEKDATIRRLQYKLGTISSYFDPQKRQPPPASIPRCHTDITLDNRLHVRVPHVLDEQRTGRDTDANERDMKASNRPTYPNRNTDKVLAKMNIPRTPEFSIISTTLLEQVKELKKGILKNEDGDNKKVAGDEYNASPLDHLLTLMEAVGVPQCATETRTAVSPASDLERSELLCESPHEEIMQLQRYFFNVLGEVESLKLIIERLQLDQQRTDAVLKSKDGNIKKLANEVKALKTKRTHAMANVAKANKSWGQPRNSPDRRCHGGTKKGFSSKPGFVRSKSAVSKTSLTNTSEEEIECPFYKDYVKKESKSSKKPEVKNLWTRHTLNTRGTEESVEIRMPMIEETTTPHSTSTVNDSDSDSVGSVQEKQDKPCKKAESL